MNSGIYAITSPSGKQYVGSAVDFSRRWSGHKSKLKKNNHPNIKLQNAWNKYGENRMIFTVLFRCPKNDLLDFEQCFLDDLKPYYNIFMFAGSSYGMKHSQKAKNAISKSLTGRKKSVQTRQIMSESRKGMRFTEKHCKNISLATKGKPKDGSKRMGMKLSDDHKRAISNAMRGKRKSDQTRRNMCVAQQKRHNYAA